MRLNDLQILEEKELGKAELTKYIKKGGPHARSRIDRFIEKLKNREPFPLAGKKESVKLKSTPEIIADLEKDNPVFPKKWETEDGDPITLNKLEKTPDLGGSAKNIGDIAEGILGAALAARFKQRPPENISETDVNRILDSLKKESGDTPPPTKARRKPQGETVSWKFRQTAPDQSGSIHDNIVLTIRLAEANMRTLRDRKQRAASKGIQTTIRSAVKWVNQARIKEYAEHYYQNSEENKITIHSDGLSNQKGTKADVTVWIDGEPTHLNISLKAQRGAQFGQEGGSGFDKQEKLWKKLLGIEIGKVEGRYNKARASKGEFQAIKEVFQYVVGVFNTRWLAGDDDKKEFAFLKAIGKGIRHYGALGDKSLTLVHLGKNVAADFEELSFENVEGALKGVDLEAKMHEGVKYPEIHVFDQKSNKILFKVRVRINTTKAGYYTRTIIEKGPLLSDLLRVEPEPEVSDEPEMTAEPQAHEPEDAQFPVEPGNEEPAHLDT